MEEELHLFEIVFIILKSSKDDYIAVIIWGICMKDTIIMLIQALGSAAL